MVAYDSKAFCLQKMLYVEGQFFSRSDLVNFSANKLGGTHLHSLRKVEDKKTKILYEIHDSYGSIVTPAETHGQTKMTLMGPLSSFSIEEGKKGGGILYDMPFLVTLDTARRFYSGIELYRNEIELLVM